MTPPSELWQRRKALAPIGVVEHHLLRVRTLGSLDISERLIAVEDAVLSSADELSFDPSSVMKINHMVTKALEQPEGTFEREDDWRELINSIEECDGFDDDLNHAVAWIFSSLYWDHLTVCQFSTAWFYTNALRVKHQFKVMQLDPNRLGSFLDALSGSGPPVNDGQTFFPDDYGP